ncbi:Susd4 [Phodopus roborovskii]|uniref:Sushi domain-containing protein 4 n=1 Tax=Phodopus roborovskii TaxID=109678 RepID=A0AAU9ZAQ8_PHORO|nr:Susd4 [Phodopus roborovskii]
MSPSAILSYTFLFSTVFLCCVKILRSRLCHRFDDVDVCGDPGVPENGFRTPSGGVFFENAVARFHCQDGFKLKGSTKRLCVKYLNGTLGWVPSDKPVCIQEGCLRPLASSNGYVNISEFQTSFPVGTVIAYRCFPGFKLEGSEYLECLHNLIWTSSPPRCLALEEQTWPSTHETLLTTWKIVAFTATSVLLVLLLVILARMFQTKFKAHFPPRGPPRSSSSDPDFVVVDGVPVMLPTYDEAVNGGSSALGPRYLASVGQGCPLPVDDQSPPAYPGSGDTDTGPGESETCDSTSGSSELLQSLYSAPVCQGGSHPAPDTPDTISSTAGEVASTSPGIDIADEIPLMEEDP